jgi:Glycosyl transferases group 1
VEKLSGCDKALRVGYVPISEKFDSPGDSRRFIRYAAERNILVEIADINRSYDFVVLTQAADLSVWRNYKKSPIVFDFIDSYYALPRTNLKALLRGLAKFIAGKSRHLQLNYWAALESMCRHSAAVVCSTDEQRRMILNFNWNTHVILDMQDFFYHHQKSSYRSSAPIKLVWEGLPQNINSLKVIKDVLNPLIKSSEIELHIITDKKYNKVLSKYFLANSAKEVKKIFPVAIFHEWNKNSLVSLITSCDIAIIPIDLKNSFAAGKPENKLLLFWRMGMPVITSSTDAYKKAMHKSGFNLTCINNSEWVEKLNLLIGSENLRRLAATSGFKVSQEYYSNSKTIANWDALLSSLCLDSAKSPIRG